MDRLRLILTLVVGSLTTGVLLITVLSLGWYSWPAIAGAVALGTVVTWPISHLVSRRIKRQDPDWDESKADRVEGILPVPGAPEV